MKKLTILMPDHEHEALNLYADTVGKNKTEIVREFVRSLPVTDGQPISLSSLLEVYVRSLAPAANAEPQPVELSETCADAVRSPAIE